MTLRVGIVGCGNVCRLYLQQAPLFAGLRFVACADLRGDLANAMAAQHGLQAMSVSALLDSNLVDVVLNLTVPAAHADIALQAIDRGKHVYQEKPLATQIAHGRRILVEAGRRGVRVGCAPDTVLGAAVQTARSLIDEGAIGDPVLGCSQMLTHGMEHFHPDPAVFYRTGGGPVFDRAPYDIGALVTLLGPVAAVQACGRAGGLVRTVATPDSPRRGEQIAVDVPTSVQGLLHFCNGTQISFMSSWDVWRTDAPALEIHGTVGSLSIPDPNWFGGSVMSSKQGGAWQVHDTSGSPVGKLNVDLADGRRRANYRGLGLAEMIQAIEECRPHRASGELALHTLAVMQALIDATLDGRCIRVTDRCSRPDPLTDQQARTLLA